MGSCVSCDRSSHDRNASHRKFHQSNTTLPEASSGTSVGMREGGGCGGLGGSAPSAHRLPSTTEGGPSNTLKGEKKTFYSRIPPLGRSGSEKNRSSSGTGNNLTATSAIDNNNAYSESKIAALFETYRDRMEDAILAEGMKRLCINLDVKPEDFKMLLLAWKCGAEQMCRFTRAEFFNGMKELKTDTLQGVQARLPDLVTEVHSDPAKYKDLYRFAFRFALDVELNQRILPVDMAVSLWGVVFAHREPQILPRWVDFLEAHPHIRGIPRDTWNMFLNLVDTMGPDLSNYDDTEAWPSLFDDFVEYENDRLNQNTIMSESGSKRVTPSPTGGKTPSPNQLFK